MLLENATLPIVSAETILITYVIDTKEKRKVTSINISKAFLQTYIAKDATIVFESQLVHPLIQIDYTYEAYINIHSFGK